MNNQEQKEKIIQEALMLLEDGKSENSILETYPDFKNELVNLFQTVDLLKKQKTVVPSEELLRNTLAKINTGNPIKSPYQDKFLFHLSKFQKYSFVSVVAVVLVITGGAFLNHHSVSPQQPASNNISQTAVISQGDSDASLNQDLNAIDTQMNGLDSDNSNTDQALSS